MYIQGEEDCPVKKKLQFATRLWCLWLRGHYASDQSAVKLPFPPPQVYVTLLFQALLCKNQLRDVTITVVTGSPVLEQERKQEVASNKPQIVLCRPACLIGRCLVFCGRLE